MDLPRTPPVEPEHVQETFKIKPGFRLELAAEEPLVVDPIALSFDENGRMFVVEMRDYSERRDEHLGRIRMLEDTDGDGRFDKSTVYADNLPWPTAVICYNGGVFVAATPDILYFKDTNGDGVADVHEVVFTGFGKGVERLNVQQLLNSFNWGLDNRIYGANGGNGGSITSPKHPDEKPLDLRGRDFSFDPRTLTVRAESGGGQYGLTFDDRGRRFICSNSSHIRPVMYEERYAGRNPFLTLPPPSIDIAVDGPAAEVYRISPDEPWRVLRTKWRVAGLVPGLIEGGGRPSGYFTSATGITIYRGDAWPEEFRGDAFVADCGSNLVHRKRIFPDGVGYKAERAADEQKVEFLASRDLWFRPVQMANAPDGTLYVIDMYREVIEHPWSFPQNIKKLLDLNSGNDRGRIYRIVPDGFRQRELPRLGAASSKELVATLEHSNGWDRDTAARLIYERADRSIVPDLEQLVGGGRSPLGRMHALYALAGLSALKPDDVRAALDDAAAVVRQHGIRLLEDLEPASREPLLTKLAKLADDSDAQVRYQLALTLGVVRPPERAVLLQRLLAADANDSWMAIAVLNALKDGASEFLAGLLAKPSALKSTGYELAARKVATIIGTQNHPAAIDQAIQAIARLQSPALLCSLGNALGEGVQQSGSFLWRSSNPSILQLLTTRGTQLLQNESASADAKLQAIRMLGQSSFADVRPALTAMLEPSRPPSLQKASIRALGAFPAPAAGEALLDAWQKLTPPLRTEVVDMLLRRSERTTALLTALESGKLRRTDLSVSQVDRLRKYSDPEIRQRATQLLGQPSTGPRQQAVDAFAGALKLEGRAAHGQQIYQERCATCHRLAGQGHALGPDLETVRSNGKEMLLVNIVDPNRQVMPKYVNYLAETRDGESLTGLVAVENEATVVLRQPNGNEVTLRRSNLTQFRSLGQSAMPEGLEEGLSSQDLADLIEYVLTAQPK
jgi:putative membrane-bound dehydrogenase-like protein